MIEQYNQAIAQYRQRVYSFAHYSLRNPQDAEDVTQDVLIKLWQHWQKIDHDKLNAWLMRVAHNQVIDHVRRHKKQMEHTDEYAEPDRQANPGQEIGSHLDAELFKKQLMQCIKQLDDPFRSILIMRDIQGQSYADIEFSLRLSESQVKVYLHRARRKLRNNPDLRLLYESSTHQQPPPAEQPTSLKFVKQV